MNATIGRRGDWMQTFTGVAFWPLDPRPEEVRIEDIAHALSMMCRFGGHCVRFYSVAEHSLHVSRLLPPELALAGLLHDAAEAYVVDIPRPLKKFLSGYKDAESGVWDAIADRFGLPRLLPSEVKCADDAMLLAEAEQVMVSPPLPWSVPGKPAEIKVQGLVPETAKHLFLQEFQRLYKEPS